VRRTTPVRNLQTQHAPPRTPRCDVCSDFRITCLAPRFPLKWFPAPAYRAPHVRVRMPARLCRYPDGSSPTFTAWAAGQPAAIAGSTTSPPSACVLLAAPYVAPAANGSLATVLPARPTPVWGTAQCNGLKAPFTCTRESKCRDAGQRNMGSIRM
jgi:hypothetical protein